MPTRMRPKRMDELIGGSLHWIVKHRIVARQEILRFEDRKDGRIDIVCSAELSPDPAQAQARPPGLALSEDDDAPGGEDDGSGPERIAAAHVRANWRRWGWFSSSSLFAARHGRRALGLDGAGRVAGERHRGEADARRSWRVSVTVTLTIAGPSAPITASFTVRPSPSNRRCRERSRSAFGALPASRALPAPEIPTFNWSTSTLPIRAVPRPGSPGRRSIRGPGRWRGARPVDPGGCEIMRADSRSSPAPAACPG